MTTWLYNKKFSNYSKMKLDKITDFLNRFEYLTKKPEKYLSLQENEATTIKILTKDLYDYGKDNEYTILGSNTLKELILHELDEEQIWQEVQLQNNALNESIIKNVANLLSAKQRLGFPLKQKLPPQMKNEISSGEDNEDEDIDEQEKEEEVKKTFETENGSNKITKKKPIKPSVVDDQFFKLSEMKEFLDKVEKDDFLESGSSEEEVDYFENDVSSDEDAGDENQPHYKDFFDEPLTDTVEKYKRKNSLDLDIDVENKAKKVKFALDNEDSNGNDSDLPSGDNLSLKEGEGSQTESSSDDESISKTKVGTLKDSGPSTFENRQERLKSRIIALESEALKEKPWQMKGEISADNRPQNSLLREYVEFDVATRPAPILTEKSTMKLEDIIIQRIKDKAWDDVIRKIKPTESETEYRKKLVLDHEKSKLSLAQIYEKEYLKQLEGQAQDLTDKPEVEPLEHQEIKKMMRDLFTKLDALSNFHFTPKQVSAEVKIVSNTPAITMEEVAPISVSDATLLAPEEVKAKSKGEMIGKSERTTTDKKRDRRQKKMKQKLKFKNAESKEKLDSQKLGLKNKKVSDKFLQKITKSSNVTQLKESKDKYIKSSKSFFSKLEDETKSKIKQKVVQNKLGKKLNSKR